MARLEPTDVTYFPDASVFRAWLAEHGADRDSLWVGYWKKGTGRPSVTWEETVDEALCFGWIDGIRKRVDDEAYTIRFTPRRPRSVWSLRNVERYAALLAEGRIHASGRAAYEHARAARTGVYSFEQSRPVELSAEYLAALRSNPAAWADWEGRPPSYRRQAAHWVMSAKRETTRERRLGALIDDCADGRKIKPLRRAGED